MNRTAPRWLSLLLLAMVLGIAGTANARVTLTLSSWVPPTHPLTIARADWCAEVSKATEGCVLCKVQPKPVASPPATLDAVRDGLADVAFITHGIRPGRCVPTTIAEFPFPGASVTANSVADQRIYEKGLWGFEDHEGLQVFTMFTHGPGVILNNKRPIRTLADMDSLKFRVGGGMVHDIGKALGANVILKPAPQSRELLSSGIVDGVWFPDEVILSFKRDKVIMQRTTIPGGLDNTSRVMNPATFNKLSNQDQATATRRSGEWAARFIGRCRGTQDTRARAGMQVAGIETTAADASFFTDFQARVAPLEPAWAQEAQAKGQKNAVPVLQAFRDEVRQPR